MTTFLLWCWPVIARVQEQLTSFWEENQSLATHIRDQLAQYESGLMDLREALNQAVNTTREADELNSRNQERLREALVSIFASCPVSLPPTLTTLRLPPPQTQVSGQLFPILPPLPTSPLLLVLSACPPCSLRPRPPLPPVCLCPTIPLYTSCSVVLRAPLQPLLSLS